MDTAVKGEARAMARGLLVGNTCYYREVFLCLTRPFSFFPSLLSFLLLFGGWGLRFERHGIRSLITLNH